MMDTFESVANILGLVVNIFAFPGALYVLGQALLPLYCCLFRCLHCLRYCVEEIANGLALSCTKSKTEQISDLNDQLGANRS